MLDHARFKSGAITPMSAVHIAQIEVQEQEAHTFRTSIPFWQQQCDLRDLNGQDRLLEIPTG